MKQLREFINSKPWLGWAIAGVFLAISVLLYFSIRGGGGAYSVERMSEVLTIKCSETGDEWQMTRGLMEKELRGRGAKLDGGQGLMNPKTGKATGFPFNKSQWEETIARINKEKEETAKDGGRRTRK